MLDFDDSFNVFIGTSNTDLKWFDNPYIVPVVYEVDENRIPKISKTIKLRQCDMKKDIEIFMDANASKYYPNSICFEDKKQI